MGNQTTKSDRHNKEEKEQLVDWEDLTEAACSFEWEEFMDGEIKNDANSKNMGFEMAFDLLDHNVNDYQLMVQENTKKIVSAIEKLKLRNRPGDATGLREIFDQFSKAKLIKNDEEKTEIVRNLVISGLRLLAVHYNAKTISADYFFKIHPTADLDPEDDQDDSESFFTGLTVEEKLEIQKNICDLQKIEHGDGLLCVIKRLEPSWSNNIGFIDHYDFNPDFAESLLICISEDHGGGLYGLHVRDKDGEELKKLLVKIPGNPIVNGLEIKEPKKEGDQ